MISFFISKWSKKGVLLLKSQIKTFIQTHRVVNNLEVNKQPGFERVFLTVITFGAATYEKPFDI